jgi:outer membrane protein assembly factor BamB
VILVLSSSTMRLTLCIAALFLSAGCAQLAKVDPAGRHAATFSARASAPRLQLTHIWSAQVHPTKMWDYYNQEYASPVYLKRADDLVALTSEGYVTRVRASSGEVVWRRPVLHPDTQRPAPIHANAAVNDTHLFVGTMAATLHAIALNDGQVNWTLRVEDAIEGAVVEHDGRLFFADSREIFYAVDAATGKLLWRYQRRAPEGFTVKGACTPVPDGDAVYCGFADGTLAALQVDSGELIWSTSLGNDRPEFTDVDMPVLVDQDRLYVGSYAGGFYALDRMEGTVLWRAPIDSVSRAVLYRGLLYVTSAQGRVVALDPEARRLVWSYRFKDDTPAEIVPHGPYLLVTTSGGPLVALDLVSGLPRLSWRPSHGFNAAPLIVKRPQIVPPEAPHTGRAFSQRAVMREAEDHAPTSHVYLLSNGGVLYAVELAMLPAKL